MFSPRRRGFTRALTRMIGRHGPADASTFCAAEVQALLPEDPSASPRVRAVHEAAAQISAWTGLLTTSDEFELGRSATRLPSVVYWYQQGLSNHEIGRRLGPLSSSWDGERAVALASRLIATHLNRRAAVVSRSRRNAAMPRD